MVENQALLIRGMNFVATGSPHGDATRTQTVSIATRAVSIAMMGFLGGWIGFMSGISRNIH
jgi:hypothetical protein